jgi:hypothetical protein
MVITDAEYGEGLRKLKAEQPILRTDLRLYATVGWPRVTVVKSLESTTWR